tara:strand:+ start:94 stop:531 length:438 start_codon:yes stop_codon:yes gene_type:complete
MSAASLSAAKKRRATGANTDNNTVVPPRDFNSSTKQNGLTMQQVITAFNSRITKLEENINDSSSDINVTNDEIDSRFQILVNEIQSLKDMVLKVQSFTMEVNKTLFDERIKVLTNQDVNISEHINDIDSELLNKETQELDNKVIE